MIFINTSSDIVKYADDATPYGCAPYYDKLKEHFEYLIVWSMIIWKLMLLNIIFYHRPIFIITTINSDCSIIKSGNSQKILGVTTDSNFTFEEHINNLSWKSVQKLHALSKISQYLSSPNKKRILFKTFVTSQLNYFLLSISLDLP